MRGFAVSIQHVGFRLLRPAWCRLMKSGPRRLDRHRIDAAFVVSLFELFEVVRIVFCLWFSRPSLHGRDNGATAGYAVHHRAVGVRRQSVCGCLYVDVLPVSTPRPDVKLTALSYRKKPHPAAARESSDCCSVQRPFSTATIVSRWRLANCTTSGSSSKMVRWASTASTRAPASTMA